MDFFEPCSTMPAWQAWVLVFGIIFTIFCSSIIFNYVSFILFTGYNGIRLVLL